MLFVNNASKKHWFASSSWGVAKIMHGVLLETTKLAFAYVAFINSSANEVTTIDNTWWLLVHYYVVDNWKRISIHLCMEIVGLFATTNNFLG
jgi:hypothetical protein